MKRAISFLLLFGAILTGFAAEFNSKQLAVISGIESYLKGKGYNVERRDDDLKMTIDGNTYYVEFDASEDNPMYVRLVRYVKFDNNIKRDKTLKKLKDCNQFDAVKVLCKEKNVILSSEMYVSDARQFNNVFATMLANMKKAYNVIEKQ